MSRKVLLKKRILRRRIINICNIAIFISAIIAIFILKGVSIYARSASEPQEFKYYTSYELDQGDSLWDIATFHYNHKYDTIDSYMDEVCKINNISKDTTLYAGMNLIIPYYSDEFK